VFWYGERKSAHVMSASRSIPNAEPPLAPSEPSAAIDALLQRARSRLSRHFALEASGVALLFAALLLVVSIAIGSAYAVPTAARVLLAALAVAGVCALIVWRGVRPALRFRRDDALALHLERAFPMLRTRLISAVQLRRDLDALAAEPSPRLSPTLIRALVRDASAAAGEVDLRAALPKRTWDRNAMLVLVIGLGIVGFVAFAPERAARAFANLAGGVEVAAGSTADEGPPLIGDLTLRYAYPEYTGYAPRVVEGTSGAISAVKGTVVQVTARAAIDVRAAEIRMGRETIPLRIEGRRLEGALTVVESGTYQFFVTGEDGLQRAGGPAMRIDVEADRHPRVRLLAPGPEVIVGERGRVDLRFSADDDFGLRDVSIVYKVEGSSRPEQVRRLRTFDKAPRSAEGGAEILVFDFAFRPGERVAYRLRVHDNDTVSGPKPGDSATQFIKVYSPRERHLELIEEEKRVWEAMVHLLGEQIVLGEEAKAHGAAALAAAEDAARKTSERAEQIVERLRALLRQAREDKMFDARSVATLEGVRRRISERGAREGAWRKGSVGAADARLAAISAFMPRHVAGIEADVLLVEKLFKQQKLEALRALARELVDSQKRLRELLERYRKTRDPALKAEIEREIARLEEKVRELRSKLAELFDVDDEFVNLDAVKAKDLQRRTERLKDAMQKGDLDRALEQLERMSKELQNTLEKVDLSAKSFYESAFYKSQKEMEKLLDEVHELENEQRDIGKQTGDIEQSARKRAAKEVDTARSEAARRVARRLEEAQRQSGRAANGLEARWNRELAEKAAARAEDASRALGQGDAAETLDMAKRTLEHLQQLDENLSRERPWKIETGPKAVEAQESARHALKSAREAVRDLERLLPRAGDRLSDAERRRLGELGRRQRALRERTGKLRRRLDSLGEEAPVFGDDAKQSLGEAHEQMSQAETQLGRGRPKRASRHEQGAADSLGRLKDQLQQAMQQGASQGASKEKDGEGEGRSRSAEPVKIPGADEHQTPKEFREDLLKAMKQGVPGPYRDLVRRYYEELVR
jgi:hypothetical protein